MENRKYQEYAPEELAEVPPLIKHISAIEMDGFDNIDESELPNDQLQSSCFHSPSTLPIVSFYTNHVYFSEERIGYGTNYFLYYRVHLQEFT